MEQLKLIRYSDTVGLYENREYNRAKNYQPYDKLEGVVCFANELK